MTGETLPMLRLDARVRLHQNARGKRELLGFAELVIGGAFVIKGISIVRAKTDNGDRTEPFISFPSRKGTGQAADKYFNVAHPITAEARRMANDLIIKAYREAEAASGR